ncbi:IPTL-CTERM sorting domain-containing protein [Curvibacter sp. HBC28]|uniref:IPTL-CTERM sorting domain-containing protein n=1 Tax=Curvibacter microcysteis TaxID=3026419 RepID=A0ABT5MKC2_9BURK|nr:IPTL-CTERM sorting domain-containing protein [Curvibacter sp. HBC28]
MRISISYNTQRNPDTKYHLIDDISLMDVTPRPELALSKVNPASLTVGLASDYTLSVSNTGSAATGTVFNVFEQLPPFVAFNSAAGLAGGTVTPSAVSCSVVSGTVASGQLLNCTVNLPTGLAASTGTTQFKLNVTPQSGVASSVVNKAQIDPTGANAAQTPSACTSTGTPAGCAVTASQSVGTGVSLGLSKANPVSLMVGSSSAYPLTLSNTGANPSATSLVVYDQLPANFQYDGAAPLATGSVTPTGVSCASSGQTSTGLLLTCTVSLPAGGVPASTGTAAFSISVTPLAGAAGVSASNKAAIDATGLNASQTPSNCTANNAPTAGCAVATAMSPVAPATAAQSQLTLAPAGPLVAGVASYTLTATARDSAGNVVTGQSYTYNFSSSGGSLSATSCSTATSGGSAGSCSVTLSSSVAGSYSVSASLGGTAIAGSPSTATFVAGAATAAASRVSISSGPKTANGSDAYTITATAYDTNGNLVTNASNTFSFSAPGAGAALSASSCTSTTGTCSVTLTATTAGSYAITASLGGTAVGGTNPVTGVFGAGVATAAASRVSISSGPKTANGSDAYTITATAYDANGNLVTNASNTFSFSAPGAGAALSASTCTTTTGTCSVTLTATTAGSYAITASLGGTAVGGTNPVTGAFGADVATAAASRVSISSGPKTANGSDAYTITATAYDANGNLVTNASNTFSFSSPGAGAALSASTCTSTTGTCSVTLTATTAGSYAITASLGGTAVGGTNPVTGAFVAGAATAAASRVSISSGPKAANGSDAYTITATAYDTNGNLVTNASNTFSFSAPGAGAALSASTCTSTTGTCSVTLTATTAGSYAITASLGSTAVGGTNPVTGTFVAGAATAAASRVSISSGPKAANGSDAYTITATAYDANGNVASGTSNTFSFSSPGAGAALSASTCTSTTGTCSVTLTATTAGSYPITASLGGTAVGGTNPVTGVFGAGAAIASASRVAISNGPLTADGVAAYTLTLTAYDANGNVVTGASNTFSLSAPAAGATLSANTCSTTTGTCTVTLRATTAGSYPITASLGGSAVGGTNPVTGVFVAGQPVATASRLAIDAGPKTANGTDAYTLTVTAYDAQGNLNTSTASTYSFDSLQPSNGATLSAGTCTTATTGPQAGRCSVSLSATVAGSYSVSARLDGVLIGGSNPAQAVFVAGPPTAASSRVDISAGPRMANGSDSYTLTVRALDAQGNLVTAPSTTFGFSPAAAGANLSASTCSTATTGPGAGTCSVTLTATVAGSYAITASLGGTAVGGANPVTGVFVAGNPTAASARVAISAGPLVADGVSAYTLTASATDANGNLNTASATTVTFSSPGAGASLSANSCTTATTGAGAGTCTVSLTATVAGSYPITASLGGTPLGGTNPVTGVFVAGAATAGGSRVSMDPPGPLTANGVASYTLTVRAQDAQGNLQTGTALDFSFSAPAAGGTLSATTCRTATSGPQAGTCAVTLSATLATVYNISASLGGTPVGGSNPVSARFVAGEAVAATARASIDAGPKQANGSDAYTLTASATDGFGNLDSSRVYTFNFSPPAAGASLSATSCSTTTTGPTAATCTVTLSATVSGSYAVSVSLGGEALGGTNPLTGSFVAGPSTAASARISLNSGPKIANGTDAYTLTARALDANGNLNTSAAMTVTFSGPGVNLSAGSCTTATTGAQAGTCAVTVTATVAGSYAITASVGGTPVGGTNPVTAVFVAGSVAAGSSTLAIDSGPKTANGVEVYTLTVTARDAQGNLVTGNSSFNFSLGSAGATLSASSCSTTAGVCSVTLRSTVAGTYAVTASLAGQNIGGSNPASAVFVAGAATAGSSRLSIAPGGPRAANGSDAFAITASAYDAQGNLVTGVSQTFAFSAPAAGATLSANSCTTTTGTCTVQITATVAGSYQVSATLGGTSLGGNNPVTATFQAGVATAAQSQALISTGPKLANGADAYTVTGVAYDAQGNPVTLNPVTFTFALVNTPSAASLSAASCVTPTTGPDAGRCSVTLVATSAAAYPVQVRLDGTGLASPVANSPVTGVFVAGAATAASSRISLSSGPKTANGSDAYTLSASAYDAQGNLNTATSTDFSFALSGAGASLSATTCSTGTLGTCSITVTATVAGSYPITARTGGVLVGGSNPVTAEFVAGLASAATSQISITAGPRMANGVDSHVITVTALDAQGNLAVSPAVTFAFTVPGSGVTLSATQCVTATAGAGAGTCTVNLTATVAGSHAVTGRLAGVPLGGSNPVSGVFVAQGASAARSMVTLDVSGGVHYANGSDSYTITATAMDAMGNLNQWQPQTFEFVLQGVGLSTRVLSETRLRNNPVAPGATLSANQCTTTITGPTAGTCSITLRSVQAGWTVVQASLAGVPLAQPAGGQVAAQFMPGPVSAASSSLSLDSGPKLADGQAFYTLTATARDAQDNLKTDAPTIFSFSHPGAGASLNSASCSTATSGAGAGTCSVTLRATVAGVYPVQATVGGVAVGVPANGQVNANFVNLAPAAVNNGVTAVPTLGEWALLGLVGLMPWLAWAQRRPRKLQGEGARLR